MRRASICIVLLIILTACGDSGTSTPQVQIELPELPLQTVHIVRRGDWLRKIALMYNVGWEEILLRNEQTLRSHYERVCSSLSARYRNNASRRGTFCNDRFRRPYGNTLTPGLQLVIPASRAPEAIQQVVIRATGYRVALVVDDTGSMQNDTREVAQFYAAAVREHEKNLIGIWLYADGHVRKYESGDVVFQAAGQTENTYGALRHAAAEKPDTIVLVTDEPGDDWPPSWEKMQLPPVVAHCIQDREYGSCRTNLQRLAEETHGEYIEGI